MGIAAPGRRSQGGRPFPPSPFAARAHPHLPVSEKKDGIVTHYLTFGGSAAPTSDYLLCKVLLTE